MSIRESVVRDHFAAMHPGVVEYRVPLGKVDVRTTLYAVEVEPIRTWREGCRQAMAYAWQTELSAAVALYGDCSAAELQKILAICVKLDIMVFVHGPEGWVELDADTPAIAMPTEQDMRTYSREPVPPPSPEMVRAIEAMNRVFPASPEFRATEAGS